MDDDYVTLVKLKKEILTRNEQRYLEESKERLKKIITTKMKTTFIGALSAFENSFGELLGLDKSDNERNNNEQILLEKWEECRKMILDNGNKQLKSILNEMDNQTISWNRYNLTLPIKENKN